MLGNYNYKCFLRNIHLNSALQADRMSLTFQVKNVKVHFKTHKNLIIPKKTQALCITHSNFITLRSTPYVFVIFAKSGHVNVSGIRNFEDIKNIIPKIKDQLCVDVQESDIVIDNSTASGQISNINLNFHKLQKQAIANNVLVILRPHFFPSALIRQKKTSERIIKGTIILFQNGKFIIVGCKSYSAIEETFKQLCVLTTKQ